MNFPRPERKRWCYHTRNTANMTIAFSICSSVTKDSTILYTSKTSRKCVGVCGVLPRMCMRLRKGAVVSGSFFWSLFSLVDFLGFL